MRLGPHPESKPPSHLGGGESRRTHYRQQLLGQALRLCADFSFVMVASNRSYSKSRQFYVIIQQVRILYEVTRQWPKSLNLVLIPRATGKKLREPRGLTRFFPLSLSLLGGLASRRPLNA
jgi:hypothetical protein